MGQIEKNCAILDLQKVADSTSTKIINEESEQKFHQSDEQRIRLLSHLFADEKS